MKVYELMSLLAECDAGAEVEFSAVINVSEFESLPIFDTSDEGDTKNIGSKIVDVDQSDNKVYLFGE